jgi:hypothetical protein
MIEELSLSIFTLEADRKPVLAFAAKKHHEAEAFRGDERIRMKLMSVRSGGVPVCDEHSILWVRLAHPDERASYREQAASRSSTGIAAVFLIDVDETILPS